MMSVEDRAVAIKRAQRALKAVADHPDSTQRQLGACREGLNACFRLADPAAVWQAVRSVEAVATAVYGVPREDELRPRGATHWVAPRGLGGPARPRRPRRVPRS